MVDILDLAEMESDEQELIPEILPIDARLSIKGNVSALIELFDRAVSVAPTKEIIAGTSFALLEAFGATESTIAYAQITATDGDQSIAVLDDSISVNMAGGALLPGKRILDILKLAPTKQVRLDVLGNTATIRSGRAVWTVQTPVGDSLPPFPETSNIVLHQVNSSAFLTALEIARKAVATTTARTSLMQAQLKDGKLTACDSARVHRQSIPGLPKDLDITLPIRLMDEAIRALKLSQDEFFELGANAHTIVFRFGKDILIGQRLIITYPDIEPLLLAPAMKNTQLLTLNTKELATIVKRVRVNADPDYAAIFLALIPTKVEGKTTWTLAVRAKDRAGNTSQELLEVWYQGGTKAREICVNHKYLLDLLSCYEQESGVFRLGEDLKTKPAPILVEDVETGFMGIVTPMSPNLLR